MSNFYGTEIEIWAGGAGFGMDGTSEKKLANYEQLVRVIFSWEETTFYLFFFFFKYCSLRTKKLLKMKVKNVIFFLEI